MKEVLRVKFKSLIVTESCKDYEGSLTLDEQLCHKAGLKEYDQIEINNHNGNRDRTYILFGKEGQCQINGALSSRHRVGDEVHVLQYELVENHMNGWPRIITTEFKDGKNKIPD